MDTIDAEQLREYLKRLDNLLDRPGVLFVVGGSSLTLLGIKDVTLDIDLALAADEADPVYLLEAINKANGGRYLVDVVKMSMVLPLPDGYAERAELAAEFGNLRVYHFDPYSIALHKLARSEERDVVDVSGMLKAGRIGCAELRRHFANLLAQCSASGIGSVDQADLQWKFDAFHQQHCQ